MTHLRGGGSQRRYAVGGRRAATVAALFLPAPFGAFSAPPSPPVHVRTTAEDTTTFDYVANGVHVIQRLTPGNNVVAIDLFMLGGVMQLTPATAGVEDLSLRAADYGSQRYPGSTSRRAMALTGSRYQIRADADWSVVSVVGLADVFDSTWA